MLQIGNEEKANTCMQLFNRLTLTQQWISATLLALLPLVGAVVYASHYLSKQAQIQRDMVVSIDRLNNMDAHLSSQITDIDRSARQYILLRTDKFYELFEQNIENFDQLQTQLAQELSAPQTVAALNETTVAVRTLLIDDIDIPIDQDQVFALLQQANSQIRLVNAAVDEQVQKTLDRSELEFKSAMQQLVLIGVLAVPGTVLLVIMSSVAVARPVWRMVHAVRRMGNGHWQEPFNIGGPKDLRSLGHSLEWMRHRLDTTEKQKQAFLRHITHELKTPLAAIMEAGSLLRDEIPGPANAEQQQVIHILMSNADNLQALIQQLLNYNAVAHGMLNTQASVDVLSLCHKIRAKLVESRPHSQVQWSIGGEPRTIRTDPQAIDMILRNLLSNAHDFSPKTGKVEVSWGVKSSHWWLRVADDGPGLDLQEQENIFKPFYQGKARRRGPLKGTGLGLAIVQECVAQLRGKIDVESDRSGATFILRFPVGEESSL